MTALENGRGSKADRASIFDGPARRPGSVLEPDRSVCHFGLAPPRHFIYPALLLLLREEPRYGYRLIDALLRLGMGPVSRPSVYRALADLEHDGLLDSWSAEPKAGSVRHMYGLTDAGREQLGEWMKVITTERDALDRVVDRFDHGAGSSPPGAG